MPRPVPHNRMQIKERRENVLVLLTRGMKGYEIAKELGVDASTVSRNIQYLISQSHKYLNNLAKETLPFMYQTSTEIAQILGVHVSTICRDVKVLKELSQRFVFDLAKGDLTYYYKQCIDGMDEIRREAWSLYKYGDWSQGIHLTVKEKIAALKLLKECDEAKFALLEKGTSVLNVKGMEEKLEGIQKYKDQAITYSA